MREMILFLSIQRKGYFRLPFLLSFADSFILDAKIGFFILRNGKFLKAETNSTRWRVVVIVVIVVVAVALVSGILLALAVVNKPLKQCIFYWLFRRPHAASTQG